MSLTAIANDWRRFEEVVGYLLYPDLAYAVHDNLEIAIRPSSLHRAAVDAVFVMLIDLLSRAIAERIPSEARRELGSLSERMRWLRREGLLLEPDAMIRLRQICEDDLPDARGALDKDREFATAHSAVERQFISWGIIDRPVRRTTTVRVRHNVTIDERPSTLDLVCLVRQSSGVDETAHAEILPIDPERVAQLGGVPSLTDSYDDFLADFDRLLDAARAAHRDFRPQWVGNWTKYWSARLKDEIGNVDRAVASGMAGQNEANSIRRFLGARVGELSQFSDKIGSAPDTGSDGTSVA